MNLGQFVAAYTGRFIDFDGMYGPQCVDLVDRYVRDVLGRPVVWANAIDWFNRDQTDYVWTRNNPADIHQLPPVGAIMVWGPDRRIGTGVFGHIAVVLQADVVGFSSFDQNWPLGAACHQVRHSYFGIIGWGVAKVAPAPSPTPISTPPVIVPAPTPAPAPIPPPVNPPIVSPPPFKEDPPVAITPPPVVVDIPEPQPVAEAGVSTSEWKALIGYVVQLAAVETGALLAKFQLHAPDAVLNTVGSLEVLGVVAVASYIVSRGIRKLGTTK